MWKIRIHHFWADTAILIFIIVLFLFYFTKHTKKFLIFLLKILIVYLSNNINEIGDIELPQLTIRPTDKVSEDIYQNTDWV